MGEQWGSFCVLHKKFLCIDIRGTKPDYAGPVDLSTLRPFHLVGFYRGVVTFIVATLGLSPISVLLTDS